MILQVALANDSLHSA